jgi:hypothetical protein
MTFPTQRSYRAWNNGDWLTSLQINVSGGPLDITGALFLMQVRRTAGAPLIDLELSTENGRLRIADGAGGKLAIEVKAAAVMSLSGSYAYDIVMDREGQRFVIQEGSIEVVDGKSEKGVYNAAA